MTRVFRFDPKARLNEVAEAARALGERPEVLAVVLFGSLARGEATPRSDADLLLLVGEAPPFLERPGRYLPLFADLGFPVDLFVYTPKEAEANPLARRALAEGRVLAERKG